ncbi:MAG: hypothetical protein K6T83_00085 [Alicyclobacillus sp.]|nr:hypothetical protein [Alicyclobacillus sp.]
MVYGDVSDDFEWNAYDAYVARELLKREATPDAIKYFASVCNKLSDYAYWFFLGTLWVSYTGYSDLNLWKRLFSARRPRRKTSLMKPSELRVYEQLPNTLTVYRAHRTGEKDWISYTLDREIAARFAHERGVSEIVQYRFEKRHAIALFLRRDEEEVLMLDKRKAEREQVIELDM